MLIKTLKFDTKNEKARSLVDNFITINQYSRIYADEESLLVSSFLNRIEVTFFEDRLKLVIKPKIELLFIPFAVFLLAYVYFDPFLLSVAFAVVSYAIFIYEQIEIYMGIKSQLKTKNEDITE